jgi:hypothetical protein
VLLNYDDDETEDYTAARTSASFFPKRAKRIVLGWSCSPQGGGFKAQGRIQEEEE